mmetsp:Transcript_36605/g.105267  ORF Transcript_36605/g.105267 Transcript_36605/m.105267 type:complete len:842 (-) Transcript_36605:132-2657(-)
MILHGSGISGSNLEVPGHSPSNSNGATRLLASSLRSSGVLKPISKGHTSSRGPKRALFAGAVVDGSLPPPTQPTRLVEGWQMKEETAMGRVMTLFNSYTMCDVVFHLGLREIPAHQFVLSAVSPVLNGHFQEVAGSACGQVAPKFGRIVRMTLVSPGRSGDFGDFLGGGNTSAPMSRVSSARPSRVGARSDAGGGGGGRGPDSATGEVVRVEVNEKYEDFYELVRFMYTDKVALTTGNVAALIFMSDDFKVPALAEKCLAFLRSEVKPDTALRVLRILKALMKKAVLSLWHEVLERTKAVRAFKELTLAERHRRLRSIRGGGSDSMSQTSSWRGAGSRMGSRMGSRRGSRESLAISDDGAASRVSYRSGATSFRSGGGTSLGDGIDSTGLRQGDIMKLAFGGKSNSIGTKYAQAERNLYMQLALVSEELSEKCWRMIREGTDLTLAGEDWVEQDIVTIRRILSLDMCNVSEAHLFRALNLWAEHQCKLQNLPLLPEHRRAMLGDGTLELVRFPTMTLEELQWEVVPTGLLRCQELRQLLMAMTGRSGWLPQFSGEQRLHPSPEAKRKKEESRGPRSKGSSAGAYAFGVYSPVEGDEIDALLGARLWRSHVEHFVEEQEDVGLMYEMGVHLASEIDVRPIICGNLMDPKAADKEALSAPHRQHRTLLRRPGARSPLEMIERELLPEVQSRPAASMHNASHGATGSALPDTLPPVVSVRGASRSIQGERGLARVAAADGGEPARRRAAVPSDFERLARGLYKFRGRELIEIKLIDGEPFVLEHGPDDSGVGRGRWEAGDDDDDDDDDEDKEEDVVQVRSKLGLGMRTHRRGVPLDTFICRTAP